MGRYLKALLAMIGIVLAAALVKDFAGQTMDEIGWAGVLMGCQLLALFLSFLLSGGRAPATPTGQRAALPPEPVRPDDTSAPAPCPACGGTIPAGSVRCHACGWTYATAGQNVSEPTAAADSDCRESTSLCRRSR